MKKIILLVLSIISLNSCTTAPKEELFVWDQQLDVEEVDQLKSFVEGYQSIFDPNVNSCLTTLFELRTELLNDINKGNVSDDKVNAFLQQRLAYSQLLSLHHYGQDQYEQKIRTYLINKDTTPKIELSKLVYSSFRSDKNELKSLIINQIQAQNAMQP